MIQITSEKHKRIARLSTLIWITSLIWFESRLNFLKNFKLDSTHALHMIWITSLNLFFFSNAWLLVFHFHSLYFSHPFSITHTSFQPNNYIRNNQPHIQACMQFTSQLTRYACGAIYEHSCSFFFMIPTIGPDSLLEP